MQAFVKNMRQLFCAWGRRLDCDTYGRTPNSTEWKLWVVTVWWAWLLAWRWEDLVLWRSYWHISRIYGQLYWATVFQILAVMPALGWVLHRHWLLRWWLISQMAWWLFIGVYFMLSSPPSPSSIFPLVMAWTALVAYLKSGAYSSCSREVGKG